MSRLSHWATLSLAAFLLAGMTVPAQAQDKSRARPKPAPPAPMDEKSAGIDEAIRISGVRIHLAFVRSHMKQILDEEDPSYAT